MADKLSINININGRIYPLKIDRKDEERIRKAAKMINDIVLEYKKKYVNQDAQDFLAMTAFQFVLKNLEMEEQSDESPIVEEIRLLDEQLSEFLSLNE
ncbi:cell division protein ZapA [Mangrovibacterium diazotrophicum]|uniref:Cell division protein ZapA n=1 Tax=Mangrovibacterium diazotrophicum TaxID=1261403 RepID=A0A419VYM5_9BACT|nr:cell division protein ZapA [Mangrovibacterium diazotrophicum]RKD88343.1 cell division protein ZapA [Mangrovibacterium diazotrophicum]